MECVKCHIAEVAKNSPEGIEFISTVINMDSSIGAKQILFMVLVHMLSRPEMVVDWMNELLLETFLMAKCLGKADTYELLNQITNICNQNVISKWQYLHKYMGGGVLLPYQLSWIWYL